MSQADTLGAAIANAERGRPVFPVGPADKRPLTAHGLRDATLDRGQITAWWRRWPSALVSIATGEPSKVVALDVDVSEAVCGFDSLEELGVGVHPVTPTAHTPRGGCHMLFAWPGHHVKTIAGKLGRGLDIRGDGGSLILPPGPGRTWDPHLGPDTPLAPMPPWMVIMEAVAPRRDDSPRPSSRVPLSRYGEAALDSAVKAITGAPAGEQHATLNRECFAIGGLVAGGAIPSALALEALLWAARQMPSYDARRPWRPAGLDRQTREAFLDGLQHPRSPA